MIERNKYIELYNGVGSTVLGSYVGFLLGVIIWGGTGWEEIITVDLLPARSPVDYQVNYNYVIGRV